MKMKYIFNVVALAMVALGGLTSCDTDAEALEIQRLTTYDDQYFKNLRDFKNSDHEISYVYYADWAPIEGATGYKDPASWGERLVGLPDSLDICNLWMGIPTKDAHPVAYQDMVECQQKKGTRFVMHADASKYNHKFWYRDENLVIDQNRIVDLSVDRSEEAIRAYARMVVDTVVKCELDGVDYDYEGWGATDMTIAADETNKYFGKTGKWPEKLNIIDYFGSYPYGVNEEQIDYFVKQAYSGQGAGVGASGPDEKTVYIESFGQNPSGGEIEYYAVWEPGNGKHKGGCGGFYIERNYNRVTVHKDGTKDNRPYSALYRAIQIMNPAVNK